MQINKDGKAVGFIKAITSITAGIGAGAMMREVIRKNVDMSDQKRGIVIAAAVATSVIAASANAWVAKQAENQIDELVDGINKIGAAVDEAQQALEADASEQKEA